MMSLALPMALLAAAAPASALPPSPTMATPFIIDRNRPDRAPVAPLRNPGAFTGPSSRAAIELDGSGAIIRRIEFDQTAVPEPVAIAARTFVDKPASKANLTALAQAMSDAYAKANVALYSILLPRQDLSDGVVHVVAIEGYVERVTFVGTMTPLLRRYALAMAKEKPLSRSTLERYLSLMRDIPGGTIDVQILRGSRPGAVVLQIAVKRKRTDFALGFDNQGPSLLGGPELRAEVHAYGALRDGDRTDLTGIASTNFKRLIYVAGSHSTPIGFNGATLSGSVGYIKTRPRRSNVKGKAVTFGTVAAMPILRGYTRNLTATIGLDGVNSDAALFGSILSSDRTRAVRGAIGYSEVTPKAVLTLGMTVSRGLDILGARGTPDLTETVFTKINGRATYDRQIGKTLFTHLKATAQYSEDRLAGSERFAVGGQDFGRAFQTAFLTGDMGAAGSAELALRPKLAGPLSGTELYGFVDGAVLTMVARGAFEQTDYDLASAGAGIRLAYTPRAAFQLEAARAIDQPYAGYHAGWRVNVGWRLSLKK
jgi:hemolysin activation/secretion protein